MMMVVMTMMGVKVDRHLLLGCSGFYPGGALIGA